MYDLIHVGYPRAGSTWLQTVFFPMLEHSNLVLQSHGPIFLDDLFYKKEIFFEQNKKHIENNKINILSSEGYAGFGAAMHLSRTCSRLKELSPGAKILLVVRNQKSWLKSVFKYNIRLGFGHSEQKFIRDVQKKSGNYFLALNYNTVLDMFKHQFDEVKVIFFEKLFSEEHLIRLANEIGSSVPEGSHFPVREVKNGTITSKFSVTFNLFFNSVFKTKIQEFDNLRFYHMWRGKYSMSFDKYISKISKPFAFSEKSNSIINELFAESNQLLQNNFSFDIRQLGYSY